MNQRLKQVDVEKVLFWDLECVRETDNLEPDSEAYNLFEYKNRNKETDEVLPQQEVLELYKRKAALSPTHSKIVCISMGYVRSGKITVRSITGPQKFIIKEFCAILAKNFIPCGYNIIGFDFPVFRQKAFKEGMSNMIPERFNDSNKKEWAFTEYNKETNVVDLMLYLKGTYFYNQSLSEACYLAGIPSPKNGGIDGSQVSDFFYAGKLNEIREYCERDVVSTVQLFLKMQGEEMIDNVEFGEPLTSIEDNISTENPLFDNIKLNGKISTKDEAKINEVTKTLTADERQNLVLILKACLGNREYTEKETKFFNSIWKS
jgi:3'-5' exonuclease